MITLSVIVVDIFAYRATQQCLSNGIMRLRHSSLLERTKRSAYALKLGDGGGRRITLVPLSRSNRRTCAVYLRSRSRIRYCFERNAPISQSRDRASLEASTSRRVGR